jgi:hypothetical protein
MGYDEVYFKICLIQEPSNGLYALIKYCCNQLTDLEESDAVL